MKKKSVFHLPRPLRRHCVYQAVSRAGIALLVSVIWHRFANPGALDLNRFAFTFMAALFLLLGWMTYLRLDGMHMPKLKFDFLKKIRKKTVRSYADMTDYTDEEIVSFDDLDDDEKDRVRLYANALCFVLFLILSFL